MDIVRELLGVGDDATLATLAERFDVLERTIRNDIASINSFLEGSGLGLINYGPGGSIVLPDDFVELRDRLPEGGTLCVSALARRAEAACERARRKCHELHHPLRGGEPPGHEPRDDHT